MNVGGQSHELDEDFRNHKNYFQHFLDAEDGFGNYAEKIRVMMNEGRGRLIVDVNDLRSYESSFDDSADENSVQRMLSRPTEYIPPFEEAINDLVLNYDSTYGEKHKTRFSVGFQGSLGPNEVTPRGLLSSLLCQMVAVVGIITKVSAVRPKVVKSVHFCPATNKVTTREYRDGTSLSGLPTPSVYPTKDEEGNLLETEFGLSSYKDYQVVTLQEAPETAPLGQLPRSVDVIVENDLVDKCKPGDRVQATGVYRAMAGKKAATSNAVFRTIVISNNVQVLGKEIQGIVMTTNDLVNVRELAKSDNIFDILSRSIAPSIFGHEMIKQALLLQLLGGVEKNLDNGTHLRGDVNVLMVGDPSTAKSQLLRFVRNIAPLAVNTTGRGSSGVGLTAAVTRDTETGERRLEAGAMVLADRGIVCIDEFDKMSEADRVAIHEVMEQQTVTIAKAGIHATLNARCSVLAAANPVYGQYDKNKRPQENIGLPDSLLSRFDLLFVVLDKLDRRVDRRISEHVLRIHRYEKPGQEGLPISLSVSACNDFHTQGADNDEEEMENGEVKVKGTKVWQKYNPVLHGERQKILKNGQRDGGYQDVLSMEFLKKYVYYAKMRFNPTLTDASIDAISQGYAELRSEQSDQSLPVTARSLETLIRLSSAHAKARLSRTIDEVDAEKAMELMKFALYHDMKASTTTISSNEVFSEDEEENVVPKTTLKRKRVSKNVPSPVVAPTKSTTSKADVAKEILSTLRASSVECISVSEMVSKLNESRSKSEFVAEEFLIPMLEEMEKENQLMYDRVGLNIYSIFD